MTTIVKELIAPKLAEVTQTTQLTSTAVKTVIDKFTITNTTTSNVTISVWVVPNGQSLGDSNIIIVEKAILPSETYNSFELVNRVVGVGGSIVTQASSASALSIAASGREIA